MNLGLFLAGAIVLNPLNLSLANSINSFTPLYLQNQVQTSRDISNLYNQYKQGKIVVSPILEEKLKEPELSAKEKELYLKTFIVMNNAKKQEGNYINYGWHPSIFLEGREDKELFLHVVPEYLHGPRGGSGALKLSFSLGEEAWYEPVGIEKLTITLYSNEKTNISKKISEVNANYWAGRITHMSDKEVLFETDLLNKKMESSFYSALKILKINKKNVKEILFGQELLEEILEYKKKQGIIEKGNLMLEGLVYIKEIHYQGSGFIDDSGLLRAPKYVGIKVTIGEESIKGIFIEAVIRYHYSEYIGKGELGTQRIRVRHISYPIRFNMREFAKALKIKVDDSDEKETDENKENKNEDED